VSTSPLSARRSCAHHGAAGVRPRRSSREVLNRARPGVNVKSVRVSVVRPPTCRPAKQQHAPSCRVPPLEPGVLAIAGHSPTDHSLGSTPSVLVDLFDDGDVRLTLQIRPDGLQVSPMHIQPPVMRAAHPNREHYDSRQRQRTDQETDDIRQDFDKQEPSPVMFDNGESIGSRPTASTADQEFRARKPSGTGHNSGQCIRRCRSHAFSYASRWRSAVVAQEKSLARCWAAAERKARRDGSARSSVIAAATSPAPTPQ
jgi:hypothetical protein